MAAYNKFQCFVEDLCEGKHNLASDTIKIALTNTLPTSALTQFSEIAEITAQNGYAAGGAVVTVTSSAQTSGTYKLVGSDVVFTASGGSFGPGRYAVLYNDTHVDEPLIAWWDYGSSVTINSGETFTVDLDQTNGIFTLA